MTSKTPSESLQKWAHCYFKRPTVLVVDDEEKICILFRKLLAAFECRVEVAMTVEEAKKKAEIIERLGLVFLDIRLPDGSGVDVFKMLRDHNPKLPLVVMTGYPSPALFDELRAGGVAMILQKPEDMTLERIHQVCDIHRIPRALYSETTL